MIKKCCFLFFTVALFPTITLAADIYVDSTLASDCAGNYSIVSHDCSGSDGVAYNTIQEAETASRVDDIILLRGGTYNESVIFKDVVNRGTSWDNPITYRPYNNEKVILKYPEPCATTWNDDACSQIFQFYDYLPYHDPADYLIFEDFEFDGDMDINAATESYLPESAHNAHFGVGNSSADVPSSEIHVKVINCKFHAFAHAGLKGNIAFFIRNTEFYDIGLSRFDHGIYSTAGNLDARYNYFHDIAGHGLQRFGVQTGYTVDIGYNVFRNCGTIGDWDRGGVVSSSTDTKIFNNIFDGGNLGVLMYAGSLGKMSNWEVKNNIFINNIFSDIHVTSNNNYDGTENNVFTNNIYGSTYACKIYVLGETVFTCSNYSGIADFDDVPPNSTTLPTFITAAPADWNEYSQSYASSGVNTGADLGTGYEYGLSSSDTIWPPTVIDQGLYGTGWEIGPFVYIGYKRPSLGGILPTVNGKIPALAQ